MDKTTFCVDGLDRLGKSTLIQAIKQRLGYYQVIHFSKPERLAAYANSYEHDENYQKINNPDLFHYQRASFINSMLMVKSGARIIFDRWHLGEAVYSPLYRGYDGSYVFDLEKKFELDKNSNVRLILLTEDFNKSKHFNDDGQSLGSIDNRSREQEMFINAFEKSIIADKRLVCVTAENGKFKDREDILQEVLE